MRQMSRRAVLAGGVASMVLTRTARGAASPVSLVRTTDRAEGIRRGLTALGLPAAGGKRVVVKPQVMIFGADRVAVDAVGVAVLRLHGGNTTISRGAVFAQEQIARAVQLGLGAQAPGQIELLTGDPESKRVAEQVRQALRKG